MKTKELITKLKSLGFYYAYEEMNFKETYASQLGIKTDDIKEILNYFDINVYTEEQVQDLKYGTLKDLEKFINKDNK